MDVVIKEKLVKIGIDADDILERMGGSEGFMVKILRKFPADPSYGNFIAGLENGDLNSARVGIHSLKGLSANLSMQRLHILCVEAETVLKQGHEPENLGAIKTCYAEIVEELAGI